MLFGLSATQKFSDFKSKFCSVLQDFNGNSVLKMFFILSLFIFSKLIMYMRFKYDNKTSSFVGEYEKLVNLESVTINIKEFAKYVRRSFQ